MYYKQLHSKGESDRLSLPAVTRRGRCKKSSNQPEMEQQQDQLQLCTTVQTSSLPEQPLRLAFPHLTAKEPVAPSAGQADKSSSTPP